MIIDGESLVVINKFQWKSEILPAINHEAKKNCLGMMSCLLIFGLAKVHLREHSHITSLFSAF